MPKRQSPFSSSHPYPPKFPHRMTIAAGIHAIRRQYHGQGLVFLPPLAILYDSTGWDVSPNRRIFSIRNNLIFKALEFHGLLCNSTRHRQA